MDRRVAMCIPNIFFKLKRLQIKQIKDKVTLAVRKCNTVGKKMTASEVLSPNFVDRLVKQDDGFRVLCGHPRHTGNRLKRMFLQ